MILSTLAYVDSSAVVKTIVEEHGSRALIRFLRDFETHASSELTKVEVLRAIRRAQPSALPQATAAIERLVLIEISTEVLDAACYLDPPELRTLDALYVATARELSPQLGAFVTYDDRMAAAGAALGLPVEAPM